MTYTASIEKLFNSKDVWFASPQGKENLLQNFLSDTSTSPPAQKGMVLKFDAPDIDTALVSGGLCAGAFHEFFYDDTDFQVPLSLFSTLTVKRASTR